MNWDEYEARFKDAARARDCPEQYVDQCLHYARPLIAQGLPPIYNLQHLSLLVGYDESYIRGCAYCSEKFYRRFHIAKRSGGLRTIDEPLPSLKDIQRWVLGNVLSRLTVSRFAKGFVAGRDIKENARFHRAQPVVLSLDIRDFFPSIQRHRVYGIFRSLGYSQEVSNILGRVCTRDNQLPQGAPTSPALSNLFARRIDRRLARYARSQKLRYTRYADDITLSGQLRPGAVISMVERVLADEGLQLNHSKTRAMQQHQRQEVTGIVVNNKLDFPRDIRRRLRQATYYIEHFGLSSHLSHTMEKRARYLDHLIGLISTVLYVHPGRSQLVEARERLIRLNAAKSSEEDVSIDVDRSPETSPGQ